MSNAVDLNLLRANVLNNQASGDERPGDRSRQILVDREGGIRLSSDVDSPEEERRLSKVPQETFASRAEREQRVAATKMPRNTRTITTPDGVRGWLYHVRCELGSEYQLFAYYDGAHYQVMLVSPTLERHWHDPHTGHLYADGRICFGTRYNSGQPGLEDAYAKSVLWVNGISIALRTGTFPFSINNL